MIFQLFWARLAQIWALLSCFGFRVRFFVDFQRCSAKPGSKMEDQVGTKLAASCGQELPRCCQDGQLGQFLVSFGRISEQFWKLFGVFFCGWVGIAKSMKTTNSPSLLLDFRRSGGDFSVVLGKFWCRFGLSCVVLVSGFVFL